MRTAALVKRTLEHARATSVSKGQFHVMGKLGICGLVLLVLGAAAADTKSPVQAMQVSGHGPVVVFESALGEAHSNWNEVSQALAPCLTVVTYDRPGIAASPPPKEPTAPVLASVVAEQLLAELRARGLVGPYLMVGHSIGGLYVQAFARNYPDAVAGMVLVDASSPLEPPGVFVSKAPLKPGSVEAAEEQGVGPSSAALLNGPHYPLCRS